MSEPTKMGLVPALRFPEFRESGVWDRKPLSEIGEILQGYGFPEAFQGKTKGEYPFYKVSDISNAILNGNHFIDKAVNYIDKEDLALIRAKTIPTGTTIFAKIGEAIRSNRRALTTSECLIDNNVAGVKAIHSKANDLYIFYVLSQINLIEYAGGAVPSVNKTTLENIPVFSTRPEEQQKIADCLSSIDELVTAQAQKVEALKAHKKGLMQQLFPAEGETVPKLRFPEFRDAGEWEIKPLGKVGENLDSKRVPITENDRVKGLVPYYGASGIIDYVKDFIFDEELLCISEDGANLVARTYPIAFSISEKAWVNNHAHVLKFKKRFTQIIIENYLNSISLEDYLTGMAQPKLNRAQLDIISIPLPDDEEQQQIANCLTSIDDLITAQTQKLTTLKAHKKGLMQQLFPTVDEVNG